MDDCGKFDLRCEYKSDRLDHLVRFNRFKNESATLTPSPFYYVDPDKIVMLTGKEDRRLGILNHKEVFVEIGVITSSKRRATVSLEVYGQEGVDRLKSLLIATVSVDDLVEYIAEKEN